MPRYQIEIFIAHAFNMTTKFTVQIQTIPFPVDFNTNVDAESRSTIVKNLQNIVYSFFFMIRNEGAVGGGMNTFYCNYDRIDYFCIKCGASFQNRRKLSYTSILM